MNPSESTCSSSSNKANQTLLEEKFNELHSRVALLANQLFEEKKLLEKAKQAGSSSTLAPLSSLDGHLPFCPMSPIVEIDRNCQVHGHLHGVDYESRLKLVEGNTALGKFSLPHSNSNNELQSFEALENNKNLNIAGDFNHDERFSRVSWEPNEISAPIEDIDERSMNSDDDIDGEDDDQISSLLTAKRELTVIERFVKGALPC